MRRNLPTLLLFFALGMGLAMQGQEPESAELYLEAYSDSFQEKFFEALKEKGIENYDRATALLLECKQLQPDNPVLDHELAKTLSEAGDLAMAESYALVAVEAEPAEFWYLNTLMGILRAQYKDIETAAPNLPFQLPQFRVNLARWYLDQAEGGKALRQLENLPATPVVVRLRNRAMRMADSAATAVGKGGPVPVSQGPQAGSNEYYAQLLEGHLTAGRWEEARDAASEAIESYPLQPFFYFAKGQAQLSLGKAPEAVETLEMGEELLLEEDALAQRFYKALAEAYQAIGNLEKSQSYKNKIKTGS